jgi:NTE family protein
MEKKAKHVGLALQGGGAHGAFTWGVLDRLLEEENIIADGICGTSAGAINAVVTAYGLHIGGKEKAKELLEQLWRKISNSGSVMFKPSMMDKFFSGGDMYNSFGYMFFNSMTQMFSPYQFNPSNTNPLREILTDLVDFEELKHYNKKKLFVCATNVKTNRARVFSNKEISVEAVLASACLPQFFQAIEIDGQHYWDGGYMGNPPLFPLIENTAVTDLLLIKINSINIDEVPTTARDISDRINEISFNSSLINEMHLIHYRNELVRKGIQLDEDKDVVSREIFVHSISAHEALGHLKYSSKMNTSWEFLSDLKNKGRLYAEKWLENEFHLVGLKSSFDVEKHFFDKY